MKGEINNEVFNNILVNPFANHLNVNFAYLSIEIRRDLLIEDTLNSLIRENINFRKPLRVKFVNEPGVDEGGVKKEFFYILLKQLFDPSYNMFSYHKESRLFWFNGLSFESNVKFELIGILMGIAIYN